MDKINSKLTKFTPNFLRIQQILTFLTRNASVIFNYDELFNLCIKNTKDNPLILKFGIDASGYSLHFGHLVPLMKIKEFLSFLHCKVFLIVGHTTTLAHDPGRGYKTKEEITEDLKLKIENIEKQLKFVFRDYDENIVQVVDNSTWLEKITINDFIKYSKYLKIKDLLNKFKLTNMSLSSAIYPILQGIDSLVLNANIEFGGMDQLTNILLARELTSKFGKHTQVAFLTPLIPGKNNDKMSKSKGNAINLSDNPNSVMNSLLSLTDIVFFEYCRCLGFKINKVNDINELNIEKQNIAKQFLFNFFNYKQDEKKTELIKLPLYIGIPINIVVLCILCFNSLGLSYSRLHIKRLLNQKSIYINNKCITRTDYKVNEHGTLRLGKKLFDI